MVSVWMPVYDLPESTGHELAEQIANDLDANDKRMIAVEGGEGRGLFQIEQEFEDGEGGWAELAVPSNPEEDYNDPEQEIADELDAGYRLVYDYNQKHRRLEEWVEPE